MLAMEDVDKLTTGLDLEALVSLTDGAHTMEVSMASSRIAHVWSPKGSRSYMASTSMKPLHQFPVSPPFEPSLP